MGLFTKNKTYVSVATNTNNMANAATNTMTEAELLAPLASMEDLSVIMTPMTTPGASPRTRRRWSQRSSTGSQYEPFVQSPLVTNSRLLEPMPEEQPLTSSTPQPQYQSQREQPRQSSNPNPLLRQSLTRNGTRFVTPYKHDPSVMNADLPTPPPVAITSNTYPNQNSYNFGQNVNSIQRHVSSQVVPQNHIEDDEERLLTPSRSSQRQVQFLTPRQSVVNRNLYQLSPHLSCRVSPETCQHHHHCHQDSEFDDDRINLIPAPKDRCVIFTEKQPYQNKTKIHPRI